MPSLGNRCGHIPASPTLEVVRPIPVGLGGYPRILAVAAERVETFYSEPEVLPSLGVLNPTASQKRSERREALIRLLKAVLKFVDLVSLTLAVRDAEGALRNITVATLAKHADLEHRRAERALSDLAAAGMLVTLEQRIRHPDGGFRSVPAIKRVSPALFSAFGLEVALRLERKKAQKRLARRNAKAPRPQSAIETASRQASFTFAVRNLTANLVQFGRSVLGKQQQHGHGDRDPERQRRWNAVAIGLREQHPDWPADDIRSAADTAMLS